MHNHTLIVRTGLYLLSLHYWFTSLRLKNNLFFFPLFGVMNSLTMVFQGIQLT